MIFSALLKSQIPLSKQSKVAYFSLLTGPSLTSVSKCMKLFATTWLSTPLHPPRALVPVQTVEAAHDELLL